MAGWSPAKLLGAFARARASCQAGALIRSRRVMQACADIERGRVCSAWWSHDACDPHYINRCNACDGVMRKLSDRGPGGVDPKRSASGDVEGMPCGIGDVRREYRRVTPSSRSVTTIVMKCYQDQWSPQRPGGT